MHDSSCLSLTARGGTKDSNKDNGDKLLIASVSIGLKPFVSEREEGNSCSSCDKDIKLFCCKCEKEWLVN